MLLSGGATTSLQAAARGRPPGSTPPPPPSIFPLSVDASNRYLRTATNVPFLLSGESSWGMMMRLSLPQVTAYCADRKARNHNTALVMLHHNNFSVGGGITTNFNGDAPFTGAPFETPNEAYFQHADDIMDILLAQEFLVLLAPSYAGFGGPGTTEGWYDEMAAAGTTKLRTYGQWVANRYGGYSNIIWVQSGDYTAADSTQRSLIEAVALGIQDIIPSSIHTIHHGRFSTSRTQWQSAPSWLKLNAAYSDHLTVVQYCQQAYQDTPTYPSFLIEDYYENDGRPVNEETERYQGWQAMLSGMCGRLRGNGAIWQFTSGYSSQFNTAGSRGQKNLYDFVSAKDWWTGVPDFSNVTLVAGQGSGQTRRPCSRQTSGNWVMAYLPTSGNITIDMTRLSPTTVRARWFDPTNGVYTNVSGQPFSNVGNRVFVHPGVNAEGWNDWGLILDSN